ncbi:MAG: Uridylate kinase [Methanoculleus marisnigri]|jgi:uridylate kinase, putative|uniref:Uridylate kinase n=1 Tax=Methanoculleus marisnigri TaxID=2198 RepID=A0A117MF25_9EURY|nr:UMP kinase [Methanoculleus marisnigri]KUK61615.1 MAG: Uridylate kinase [Methanoculleus marisnigri]KUL00512.1 MAG: Uridylate kinase [Methanoculleus marisnigri]
MKKIVISLGGSVLVPSLESNNISRYVSVLERIAGKCRIFIVVGGGGEARRYIQVARDLGAGEATADELGILVTRLNARLLVAGLGDAAYPRVAENYTEAKEFAETGRIVVMGGITPAQTTDAVSAVLAESVGADLLINATSVNGIYSADPKKDTGAVRHEHLTPQELLDIITGSRMDAGANTVLDIVAGKVIERSGIPLLVLDGRDPENLYRAVVEGAYVGTIVCEESSNPLLS